jgi:hypothetical protein
MNPSVWLLEDDMGNAEAAAEVLRSKPPGTFVVMGPALDDEDAAMIGPSHSLVVNDASGSPVFFVIERNADATYFLQDAKTLDSFPSIPALVENYTKTSPTDEVPTLGASGKPPPNFGFGDSEDEGVAASANASPTRRAGSSGDFFPSSPPEADVSQAGPDGAYCAGVTPTNMWAAPRGQQRRAPSTAAAKPLAARGRRVTTKLSNAPTASFSDLCACRTLQSSFDTAGASTEGYSCLLSPEAITAAIASNAVQPRHATFATASEGNTGTPSPVLVRIAGAPSLNRVIGKPRRGSAPTHPMPAGGERRALSQIDEVSCRRLQ